jgi:hypothetical protein
MALLSAVRKMRPKKGRRPCLTPSKPPSITNRPPNITKTPPSIIAKHVADGDHESGAHHAHLAHAHHRHAEHHAGEAAKAHIELHHEHADADAE